MSDEKEMSPNHVHLFLLLFLSLQVLSSSWAPSQLFPILNPTVFTASQFNSAHFKTDVILLPVCIVKFRRVFLQNQNVLKCICLVSYPNTKTD